MAEKSAVTAEGSGIFESLFGGFSNGLSIFTNNPFRRKNETNLPTEENSSGEKENDNEFDLSAKMVVNDEVGISGQEQLEGIGHKKKVKKAAGLKAVLENAAGGDLLEEQDTGAAPTTTASEEKTPDSSQEKMKKVKRADEEVVSEKKRRKTESVQDVVGDENLRSGSSDSRKRKTEPTASGGASADEEAAGLDGTTGPATKSKVKKGAESEQLRGLRHSARNTKKRLNEDLLFSTGIARKERKLEKTSAGMDEAEDLGVEKDLKSAAKRGPQEVDGGEEKQKKKTKRLEEIGPESDAPNKDNEEEQVLVAPPPSSAPVMETRSGSKRKKDSNVEELYEKKRRGTVDGKQNAKGQKGNEEEGGVEATELAARLRGKRKLSSEDEGEDAVHGTKKKKTTRDERRDNEERLSRTIFVGNLPVSLKPKQLLREFCQFGAVESARLRSVPLVDTKMPRKAAVITGQLNESRSSLNGYVVFHKEESAKAALAHNMTEFHGKHIRVDMATAPRKGDKIGESGIEYDRSRSIFVGNLPFDVEDEEVYSLFQGKTPDLEVEAVRIVRDPQTSIGKGFAFVCFKKKVGATTALDNAEFTRLRNRQLRIIRFGFQRKQTGGSLLARRSSGRYTSKPRPGAEERINKRSVLSYEGTRSSKVDGRPGKTTGPARTSHKGKSNEKGKCSKSGKTEKNNVVRKRPAVAARKVASQGNAGAVVPVGGKRKREDKGVLCLPPPPPASTSAQLTGKLWSVVRSVGSYASSSFKDLLLDPESNSSSMGGSMRKLLFNFEKRPESTGATALRELSLVPSTRKIRRH
ncbi:unnamed protein product [Calypogeia fissa]